MNLPDYYNRVNPDLLRWMPPDALLVLEIGCGAGALAVAYRRVNPAVRYLGIEQNEEAARAARATGRLDHVASGDAGSVRPEELGLPVPGTAAPPAVDCLVLGDV